MRVLLVEDTEDVGEAIVARLRKIGYAVDWETNGAAADDILRYEAYDLVILDLMLFTREIARQSGSRFTALGDQRNRPAGNVRIAEVATDRDDSNRRLFVAVVEHERSRGQPLRRCFRRHAQIVIARQRRAARTYDAVEHAILWRE